MELVVRSIKIGGSSWNAWPSGCCPGCCSVAKRLDAAKRVPEHPPLPPLPSPDRPGGGRGLQPDELRPRAPLPQGWGSPWRWPTSTGRCSSLRWRKSGTRARSTRKRKRGSWRSWPQRKGLQEPQGLAIAASNTSRSPAESPAKASPEEEEEEEEEEGDGGAAWTEERRRDGRRAPPSPGQRPLCRPIPALWHGFSGSATQRRPCREHRPQADSQVCKEEGKPPGFCFHA
ncbi:uncharacterized protein LOC121919995 isoform X6 [Sceloporus undulatus]|uniref:uncharacterized protein LOC121919995 isoform X6 n=1 Tax=Sceloporus undulatus TaxID=8520 RepID=UPI001C4BAC28|nr:uncharacterized protein LOC121919995 isoform X6 [Sceloporus undulatus]